FVARVYLAPGRRFTIIETVAGGSTSSYSVRCLPADFMNWTVEKSGTPQSEWFLINPLSGNPLGANHGRGYASVFDTNGVPVWWMSSNNVIWYSKVLSDGNIAWT